jgi:hypothetical protein
MKLLVAALLSSGTISSLCQNAPQQPVAPDQLYQMPKQFQLAPPRFSKEISRQTLSRIMDSPRVMSPTQAPRLGDPHFDAKIIHRPPPASFAAQQPRSPIVSEPYPDLKLLPIETAAVVTTPIE